MGGEINIQQYCNVCKERKFVDLLLQTKSCFDEIPCNTKQNECKKNQETDREENGYVGSAEETIAETVDDVENGVELRERTPEFWERLCRIKHAAKVHERGQYERRNDINAINCFRIHAVHEPGECEDKTREDEKNNNDEQAVNREMGEEERDEKDEHADKHAADDAACDVAANEDPRRRWRNKNFINVAPEEFRGEHHERSVRVGVSDHSEHDEARNDEHDIRYSLYLPYLRAEKGAEHEEVEYRSHY